MLLSQIALKTMLLYLGWQKVLAPNNLQGSCLLWSINVIYFLEQSVGCNNMTISLQVAYWSVAQYSNRF